MSTRDDTAEQILARLAGRAHGVVTREQLLAAGVTAAEIHWRLRTGALMRVHRGVFRVGHCAPSTESTYLAAVWACGDGALLCDRAAAHLLGLVREGPSRPEVLTRTRRRVPGVKTRRTRDPSSPDAMTWRGVPVTRVPRTLVDLAAVLDAKALARACHEAGVKHRTKPRHVAAVLARRPNSPGAAKLRAILHGDTRVTLSDLEARFLELLEAEGLPLPRTNRVAGARRVDCRWPELRLTVELDSYTYHHSRHAWEQDRRREREARARGDDFRRYTRDDVFEDPAPMLSELKAAAPPGRPAAPSASPAP
ncbi:MAG TPA: type IV toxin-antitoxin system AbiEi family antitoxin domain-containing protein [Solirubrobacteraceae bacterium]